MQIGKDMGLLYRGIREGSDGGEQKRIPAVRIMVRHGFCS
jgi:hypothetical protein